MDQKVKQADSWSHKLFKKDVEGWRGCACSQPAEGDNGLKVNRPHARGQAAPPLVNALIFALQHIQMCPNEDVEENKEQLGRLKSLFTGSCVSVGFLHVCHMWARRPRGLAPGGTGVNTSAVSTDA